MINNDSISNCGEDFEINLGILKKYLGNKKNIIIPENVFEIETDAFRKSEVVSVTLPSTLIEIKSKAFYGCKKLVSIIFNNDIQKIGRWAFANCQKLEEIIIPDNCEIDDEVFLNCTSLKKIKLPNTLQKIKTDMFEGCKNLQSVIIPNGVTEIECYAFQNCKNLSEVILPDSLSPENIHRHAFKGSSYAFSKK